MMWSILLMNLERPDYQIYPGWISTEMRLIEQHNCPWTPSSVSHAF